MKKIRYYIKSNGRCPYEDWYSKLDIQIKIRISSRIERLIDGNYGEYRKLSNSELSELKLKFGKGYRIYYKDMDDIVILFLAGGDKSNQKEDIRQAEKYYNDYLERLNDNEPRNIQEN